MKIVGAAVLVGLLALQICAAYNGTKSKSEIPILYL